MESDSSVDAPIKQKRQVTDKQRENLKKGMEALKLKREQRSKEKAEKESKKTMTIQLDAPAPPPAKPEPPAPLPPMPEPSAPAPVPALPPKPKKERKARQPALTRNDVESMLKQFSQPREVVVEKPVERIIEKPIVTEKVVEKTKYLTGSDLLNRIFFS